MALALRADYRAHLALCAQTLGTRYVRGHGLLDDDVGVFWAPGIYSFSNVYNIFDFLLSINMRPIVELSFMPYALASNPAYVGIHYRANRSPPSNMTVWADLVQALAQALVTRYGEATVAEFYFEVWNEPNDAFWNGTQAQYFELYRASAQAIKRVSPRLRVGGPATNSPATWLTDFLGNMSAAGVPVDFVSSHAYASQTIDGVRYAGFADALAREMQQGLQAMQHSRLPWVMTEFGASPSQQIGLTYEPATAYHDSVDQAAFVLAMADRADRMSAASAAAGLSRIEVLSYWAFSDVFEEMFFPVANESFHGGFGLINLHGVPKPSFRALQLLHETGSLRYPALPRVPPPPPACGPALSGMDLFGGDLGPPVENVSSLAACCALCQALVGCQAYTHWTREARCGLKGSAQLPAQPNPDRASGRLPPPPECQTYTGVLAIRNSSVLDVLVYASAPQNVAWSVPYCNVTLTLAGPATPAAAAAATATVRRIDATHANPRAAWEAMGAPNYTTPAQNQQILAAAAMPARPLSQDPGAGLTADHQLWVVLAPNSLAAVRLDLLE